MHRIDIKTMVLGPISTNTYICRVFNEDGAAGAVQTSDTDSAAAEGTESRPVQHPADCFIVDPAANAPAIIEALGDVTPSSILLTHGHFDHIMAVNELREHYPGITVYAHPADSEIMLHPGRGIVRREFTNHAVTDFTPVNGGDILEFGGMKAEVISTPGHTKGGVCYYIAEKKLMFTGDTLFRGSYGRTDFETGDFEELKASIVDRLFVMFREEGNIEILPGHTDPTTSEYELEHNPIL